MRKREQDIIKQVVRPIDEEVVEFWFHYFNEFIFESQLYFFDLVIFDPVPETCYGRVTYYMGTKGLILHIHKHLDTKTFLEVLGHEMVHAYQAQVQRNLKMPEPTDKNIFSKFAPKFAEMGLDIVRFG